MRIPIFAVALLLSGSGASADGDRLMANAAWLTGMTIVASGHDVQALSADRAVVQWFNGPLVVQRTADCVYEARTKITDGRLVSSTVDFNRLLDTYRITYSASGEDMWIAGNGAVWCSTESGPRTCYREARFMVGANRTQFMKTLEFIRTLCPGGVTGPRY